MGDPCPDQAAYAYYEANEYDDAIAALERFIDLHPADKDVPYAYYLNGLSYYEQISDVGARPEDDRGCQARFQELIAAFPRARTPGTPSSRSTSPTTIWPARRWTSAATICSRG